MFPTVDRRFLVASTLCVAVALESAVAISQPASARAFLTPAQAIDVLADGQPWSATFGDSMRAKLTFNKNGTGVLQGPVTLAAKWEIKGQDVCLSVRFAFTRCLRFRMVDGVIEGYHGETLGPRLSR